MSREFRIGFLINPIAGMGGRVGLKGTDDVVEEAIKRGAEPVSPKRAEIFLNSLKKLVIQEKIMMNILSCRLNMGEDVLSKMGLETLYIDVPRDRYTTRNDTIEAVKQLVEKDADLIVFVGGDGTARDVYQALKEVNAVEKPILGVPSGVKVYSGVFAVTPTDAAYILMEYLRGRAKVMEMEVMDIDEEAFRRDEIQVKIYAYANTPYIPFYTQSSKQLSPDTVDENENQMGIAKYVVEMMDENGIYILGSGTTVKRIADILRIKKTVLGVDIYYKGKVYNDLSEKKILDIIDDKENVWIIVTPIGRQGMLFGRGNQQISPKVIKKVGRNKIIVLATYRKLRDIPGGFLRVDTQDADVDNYLKGYIRVVVDYRTWRMVEIR